MKLLTFTQLELPEEPSARQPMLDLMVCWLERGDGIAVYENQDLGHHDLGLRQYVSFGSHEAQLEGSPPHILPDIGGRINWRYSLVGVFTGSAQEFLSAAEDG